MDPNHPADLQAVRLHCAYCGEPNHTYPDPGNGNTQEIIEDCRVCCRPNVIRLSKDEEGRWLAEPRTEDD